jgi:glycosyltransferase involved in cell wall biosynthesis
MMNKKLSISVVIPILNEEEILEEKIDFLLLELPRHFSRIEIILTENGSTDRTKAIAAKLGSKFAEVSAIIDDGPADYGQALLNGIKSSQYDCLAIMELDYLDLDFLFRACAMIDEYDLIIGSKKISPGIDQRPLKRKLFTWLYNFLVRRFFRVPLSETHGLKVFNKPLLEPVVYSCITRHAVFPTEFVIRAFRNPELKVVEIPLSLPLREIRQARIQAIKRLKNTIQDLLVLRRSLKKG